MLTKPTGSIEVVLVREGDLPLLALLRAIHVEENPDDLRAADHAEAGMQESLKRYNALSSDAAWFFVALFDGKPVGYAAIVRIPKLDQRVGFLYLDELHVLKEYRRRGVGTTLIKRAFALVSELKLAGIRLLTRQENISAQRFYEPLGFSGNPSIIYQCSIGQEEGPNLKSDP